MNSPYDHHNCYLFTILLKILKYSITTIEDVRDKEEPEPFAKKENWNEQKENCKKQKEKLE